MNLGTMTAPTDRQVVCAAGRRINNASIDSRIGIDTRASPLDGALLIAVGSGVLAYRDVLIDIRWESLKFRNASLAPSRLELRIVRCSAVHTMESTRSMPAQKGIFTDLWPRLAAS